MLWKTFACTTVRGNVCAELRIYICHEFFEVGNTHACVIENPLLFYLFFPFSTFFFKENPILSPLLARKILGFKPLFQKKISCSAVFCANLAPNVLSASVEVIR